MTSILEDKKGKRKIINKFMLNDKKIVVVLPAYNASKTLKNTYLEIPLDFIGDVLFVRDLRKRNIELMKYYPEKEFYIYEFDRLKKSGKLTRLK